MKKTMTALVVLTALCSAFPFSAAALPHLWSQHFGSSGSEGGIDVATDASGNIYVVGTFDNTIDFGTGTLTTQGFDDAFLARFNSAGVCQWAKRFGDAAQTQVPEGVATDAAGNVYIAGLFTGSMNFGGATLTSAGDRDVFVAKFTPAGTHVWSKRFGDAAEQENAGLAVDASGNVFVYGYFVGSIDFGGGALTSLGSYDGYLAKFDTNGAHAWSRRYGDSTDQRVLGAATDPSGNICLTGWLNGSADFGGGPVTSLGFNDVFVAKLDGSGAHQWSARYGDAGSQYGNALAADATGNIYVTGSNQNTIDFGGGPLASAGSSDVFLVKFNPGGAHQWSHQWGDADVQSGGCLSVGPLGDVFLAGSFRGSVDFGGGPLTSAGLDDAYVAQFNSSGVHQWSASFGDANKYEGTSGVAARPTNGCVITGIYQGSIDFGGGPLTSFGYIDMFLAEFGNLPTGVGTIPGADALSIYAYPNPFNPQTTLRYAVPSQGRVTVAVYDTRGARVTTLVDAERAAGSYELSWNGRDAAGRPVSSGVYFARISHASGSRSEKLVLLQ